MDTGRIFYKGGRGSFMNVVRRDVLGGIGEIPPSPHNRVRKAISSIQHDIFFVFIFSFTHNDIIFHN